MMTNPELEAQIARNPDDPSAYLVYADWLAERGDPLGELIPLEVAYAQEPTRGDLAARARALHVAHDRTWLGTLHGLEAVHPTWKHGFLRGVVLGGDPEKYESPDVDLHDLYRRLRAAPAARFLRELTMGAFGDDDGQPNWSPATAAIAELGVPPTLRRLAYHRGGHWDISWTHSGDLSPMYPRLRELEAFYIALGNIELGAIDLPNLRDFEVYTGGFTSTNVKEVLAARWPKLERLILRFGNSEDYGADCTLEDALPLLGIGLPHLRHLGLGNAGFADELIEPLAKSKLLTQLETLDLSKGTLGDEGGARLLEHADRFRHLKHLNVSESYLSDEIVAQLRAIVPSLDADDQEEPDDDGDAQYRYCRIGE